MTPHDSTRCACGHTKEQHIYHEGACRPGFACPRGCEAFTPLAALPTEGVGAVDFAAAVARVRDNLCEMTLRCDWGNHTIDPADLRTLLAALAEARKDSERLDWLERHQGRVSGPALDNPRWVVWADDAENDVEADNFRDAIDCARRTPQPETPE